MGEGLQDENEDKQNDILNGNGGWTIVYHKKKKKKKQKTKIDNQWTKQQKLSFE